MPHQKQKSLFPFIALGVAVVALLYLYSISAGRDLWRDRQDDKETFSLLSDRQIVMLPGRFSDLVERREAILPRLIRSVDNRIDRLKQDKAWYAATADLAPLAPRKQEQVRSEEIVRDSYERQRAAGVLLREECRNGDVALELMQLPNTHLVLVVKDISRTIRDADERLPEFAQDEVIARLILEFLAPMVFDRSFNQDIPITDIVLLGYPNVVLPETFALHRVVAYKYRYPHYKAKLVVNWQEAACEDKAEELLRPTVWQFDSSGGDVRATGEFATSH